MKKYWKDIFIGIIVIFLVIPLGIAVLVSFRFICTDTSNEWIGFWGGYLGSIIGGLITLYVLVKTLQDNRESQQREERILFCNYIAEISGKICTSANNEAIFTQKAVEDSADPAEEEIYKALLAKSEIYGLLQSVTSSLLAKMNNPNYTNVQMLMDSIYELQLTIDKIKIKKDAYNSKELLELGDVCKKLMNLLGKLRDDVATFIKANEAM